MSEMPLTDPASPAPATDTPAPVVVDPAARLFSKSVAISGVRCLLAYIVFPWVLPAVGIARGVGPWVGIVVGVVAIGFNVASIRRFWRTDHRWKWPISVINASVIGLLLVLLALDIGSL